MPKANSPSAEVDFLIRPASVPKQTRGVIADEMMGSTYICNVVPHTGGEICRPLSHAIHIPTEIRITRSRFARDPARLHLGEVAFEKAYLMLSIDARKICAIRQHAKMIPHFTRIDGGRRLRDEFRPPHGLPFPVSRGVESELGALNGRRVGRVLVRWREVDVFGYIA